jgi:hypothetical protein
MMYFSTALSVSVTRSAADFGQLYAVKWYGIVEVVQFFLYPLVLMCG